MFSSSMVLTFFLPRQFPLGTCPATELITRNACVFFKKSAQVGFSLVRPLVSGSQRTSLVGLETGVHSKRSSHQESSECMGQVPQMTKL